MVRPDGSMVSPADYVLVKPLSLGADDEPLEPIDCFIEACNGGRFEELSPQDFLQKFGIHSKLELAVVVSNRAQEVGDLSVAMSSLRERTDLGSSPKPKRLEGDAMEQAEADLAAQQRASEETAMLSFYAEGAEPELSLYYATAEPEPETELLAEPEPEPESELAEPEPEPEPEP